MHIHVYSPEGEAKFWLEPIIALNQAFGFSPKQLKEIESLIEEHKNEIRAAWKKHFGR